MSEILNLKMLSNHEYSALCPIGHTICPIVISVILGGVIYSPPERTIFRFYCIFIMAEIFRGART